MNKAVQAGLVAGYLNTCAQLTDGYGLRLLEIREQWKESCRNVETHYEELSKDEHACMDEKRRWVSRRAQAKSLQNLATCGWCLAPFITFPVWLLMARKTGLRGYMTAVSVCAFTRHIAEMY